MNITSFPIRKAFLWMHYSWQRVRGARNYNSGWHAENQAGIRIHRLWCVLYYLSARGQGRRDFTCNGLQRLRLFTPSGVIFSDFSSAQRGENRFWLIGTITIRFMTRKMLRKTGFCLGMWQKTRKGESRTEFSRILVPDLDILMYLSEFISFSHKNPQRSH